MIYIFLGPPGVGKGTQAKIAAKELSFEHVSTGDMLRSAVSSGSPLGRKVKEILDSGTLVDDALILEIVEEKLRSLDKEKSVILDGFPRTPPQAEGLDNILRKINKTVAKVVNFTIEDSELLVRLSGRREKEGRSDDSEQVQKNRLLVYKKETEPLIDYYLKKGILHNIDSSLTIDEVSRNLFSLLG